MTPYTEVKLSAEHNRKWTETRSAILWACPAFTHLLYSMLNPSGSSLAALFTKDVPTAATDGSVLIINPDWFFKMQLQERMFVVGHEILHCVFNHCGIARQWRVTGKVKFNDGKSLPYDHGVMNMAMDYVINDILVESNVGKYPGDGCHDKSIGTAKDSFLDVYKKIYDDNKGQGSKGFDILLDPGASQGKDPNQAQQARSQTEWDTAVAAATQAAKLQGKLPSALERLFGDILTPEVTWQDHIRSFFARKVGAGSYDWRKPDRRMIQRDIYAPARSGLGARDVVVAIDTSGSIGQRELDRFFGELSGIISDVRPQTVHIVWCDAKVQKVDEISDVSEISGLKPKGGGGTDFCPVFDWVRDNISTPDALVYLTDGLGNFPPQAPDYPVLWGDIWGRVQYPFGDVVAVPIKQ